MSPSVDRTIRNPSRILRYMSDSSKASTSSTSFSSSHSGRSSPPSFTGAYFAAWPASVLVPVLPETHKKMEVIFLIDCAAFCLLQNCCEKKKTPHVKRLSSIIHFQQGSVFMGTKYQRMWCVFYFVLQTVSVCSRCYAVKDFLCLTPLWNPPALWQFTFDTRSCIC